MILFPVGDKAYLDALFLVQGFYSSRNQARHVVSFAKSKSAALPVTADEDSAIDAEEGRVEFVEMDGSDADARLAKGLDAIRSLFALISGVT